jgi:O-antigen/teichoic acid export membrane protein
MSKLRTLASDTAVYGVSTILQRFLTFLLTPLYTNYLAPTAMGEQAYIYSLLAFLNVLYSLGLDAAFFRFFKTSSAHVARQEIAHQEIAHQEAAEHLSHNRAVFRYCCGMIVTASSVVTLLVVMFAERIHAGLGLQSVSAADLALAACIAFFDAVTLIPYATLRMERKAKRFAGTKLVVVVLNVAANLLLVVHLGKGVHGIFVAGAVSALIGVVLVLPELARYGGGADQRSAAAVQMIGGEPLWKVLWRFGLPTLPAAFSAMMLQVADRPIMQMLLSSSAVGVYQANYRLGIPMMLVVTVFEQAWKPFYLREAGSRASRTLFPRVLTYFTVVCAAVFLVVALLIEFVAQLPFIGGRFLNVAYLGGLGIVPIVLVAYYFNGVFTNLAAGVYIRKRTTYLPVATGLAAAVNIALNFALIPVYGIMGGALATLGAYVVSAVFLCRLTRRIYPLRYEWGRVLMICSLAGLTYYVALVMTEGITGLPAVFLRVVCIAGFVGALAIGFMVSGEERTVLKKLFRR